MALDSRKSPILDHIVIYVSHATLLELPQKLKNSFVVAKGGEHADGLTVNNLVLLQDGVYIEFFAFKPNIDPERRRTHRWGQVPEGAIIDWAHTLPHESDFAAVQEGLRSAETVFKYNDPIPGGRVKADGTVLKWAVAYAHPVGSRDLPPGRLPFWCLDRTPRGFRVPYEGNPETKHPSGALGVSRVTISVPEADIDTLSQVYEAMHQGCEKAEKGSSWPFDVPSGSKDGKQLIQLSSTNKDKVTLSLRGTRESPSSVDVLPGLVFEFEH